MGLFDKFKKKFESVSKTKKPRNVVGDSSKKIVKKEAEQKKIEDKPKKKDTRVTKEDTKNAFRILRRVIVTEKASMAGSLGQYAFAVDSHATKEDVRSAVTHTYGVHPTKIHIINVVGRDVRFGKITGRTARWKKAIVSLPVGEKIDVYEGV
ncbi:MAG TPA: 50S ribosomal protein L23 [Candidatus Kerfeldbacteria bacterium]|nr:50S ribosomal protein L23 [Candidatus Kerfeldbacteria bacterium]